MRVLYVTTQRYGGRGKAFQGEMLYAADNPPYGAVITYYLKDALKTLKQKRVDAEKAADKAETAAVRRKDAADLLTFDLVREVIHVDSVTGKRLEKLFGGKYLTVVGFYPKEGTVYTPEIV